jgi:PEP-CTERM motif
MNLVRASVVAAVAALASVAASAASATTIDFKLLDNNGMTVDASGVLKLTGDVVNSISGCIKGYGEITGLIADTASPGPNIQGDIEYDNHFVTTKPGVDLWGIFVTTAVGKAINLYNVNSGGSNVPDNTATVYVDGVGSVANGRFSITSVPEPASWALMLIGVGLAGAALRSSPQRARAAA